LNQSGPAEEVTLAARTLGLAQSVQDAYLLQRAKKKKKPNHKQQVFCFFRRRKVVVIELK
jgi:hypothetical protein